ncbi:hypothetical protein ABB37_00254 [Leptomonas pyrrhocoris]|uniref:Uncharacterized protein n=1 Tax=Leptomonas pyrrhocoris TaxID=157538 RepID=A0A0N0VHJ1_LEPPY|nr:hypothetical protein ABB37_00254 [Leptomonas pyrrhocoris]KPA85958.1 hypothetical protein ABB37_00254 [Leptomonas pyrrhocoris]|eukprot:XP_015664397.1 hypothetical protein ABB37_00254 [Leptomonas pyrrhocoris]
MNILHIVLALLVSKVALQYAICAACVLAPLYAFVLKPVLRWARCRACGAAATGTVVAPTSAVAHDTPVRLSTVSSRGFLSPTSASATPLQGTPVFLSSPGARASRQRSGSGSGPHSSASPARFGSRDGSRSLRPSLEVTGTAVRVGEEPVEVEEYRSPTKRFVSALKRHVQQRGAAIFGKDDSALRAAVASGEVFIHRPARRLPSQDYLALRLLRRRQLQALYDELNITEASLDDLYASPKFLEWYGANREELLRDAQLRESFYRWRSLARAVVLLMALLLLPAFSFSTDTNAVQWRTSLAFSSSNTGVAPATVASAPFAQLLLTRMRYIQNARSAEAVATRALPFASYMRADVRTLVASVVGMAEWVAIVAAVCSLVTSCFMPRGSRRTASVAFTAFLVVLIESALVPGVSVGLGLGSFLIVIVVATTIRRAAE